jgi:hypothetical protein
VALVCFTVALLAVWSPVDFWRFLPRIFWFVQFPYRLLMVVILWGAVLSACGLALYWPTRLPRLVVQVVLVFLGICVLPYFPRPVPLWPGFVRQAMQRPEFVRPVIDAYLLNYPTIHGTTWVPEEPFTGDWEVAVAGMERHVAWPEAGRPLPLMLANKKKVRFRSPVRYTCSTDRPIVLELPVLYYPKMLEVRDNGRVVRYGNAASFLAVELGPGEHRLAVRFVGIRWANVTSAIAWIAIIAIMLIGSAWHMTVSARRRHV